jgi:tetratricopeptide (TPR) repeat protein
MASASIRLLFKEVKLGISDFDLQELINKIMEQYELHEAVQRRPKVMFEFVSLVRSAFVARKDFLNLEPFLVFHADRLFSKEQFVSKYPQLKARLVYFLAHTYYRNRNFPASLAMIETLLSDLEKLKKRYQSDLFPKAILLKAAVQSFSDQNEKSIEILNEAAETEFFKRSNADRLNLRLNLAVYYFQEGDFRLANKMLLQLPNTDKWCERTMGQEWMLKRSLIEMITQVEMGNTEIALNRIRSIQRKYRSLMERPKYELVKPFLQVVKSVVAYPERINQKMYTDKIRPTFVIRDSSEEDLQAMTYYAWLKSKFAERPYYETLLELVNR